MEQPAQDDLFGGPPPEAEPVRAATPSAEVVEAAQRLPKNVHFGTSSWSFPGWVGIVYAQRSPGRTDLCGKAPGALCTV